MTPSYSISISTVIVLLTNKFIILNLFFLKWFAAVLYLKFFWKNDLGHLKEKIIITQLSRQNPKIVNVCLKFVYKNIFYCIPYKIVCFKFLFYLSLKNGILVAINDWKTLANFKKRPNSFIWLYHLLWNFWFKRNDYKFFFLSSLFSSKSFSFFLVQISTRFSNPSTYFFLRSRLMCADF